MEILAMSKSKKLLATSVAQSVPATLLVPKSEIVHTQSKQSRVIAMLQSPAGATITAMMQATGWQQHSVRGFLAGVVRKRLKLTLESKKVDGTRVYRIGARDSGKTGSRRSKRQSS